MKKTLLVLSLICLLIPQDVWAAYAHSACSGTCTSNAVSTTLTLPASSTLTFTAGHFLAVAVHGADTSVATFSISSSPSETWKHTAAFNSTSPSGSQIQIFYANNIAGGSYTITLTATSSTNIHGRVDEYSGSPASCADPLESGPANAATTSSSSGPPATGSLTAAGADLLYAAGTSGANETFTATASGMMGSTGSIRAVTNTRVASEDRILGAGASGTAQITWSGATTDGAIQFVIFGASCPATAAAPSGHSIVFTIVNPFGSILTSLARLFHIGFLIGDRQ